LVRRKPARADLVDDERLVLRDRPVMLPLARKALSTTSVDGLRLRTSLRYSFNHAAAAARADASAS
jgi:hypothetical protein